jgi:hypothetical protein
MEVADDVVWTRGACRKSTVHCDGSSVEHDANNKDQQPEERASEVVAVRLH